MKTKFFFSLFLAVLAFFSIKALGTATNENTLEILTASGLMVTPDINRGRLALFIQFLMENMGLQNVSELDIRPFNVRLLQDMKNNSSQYKFDPRLGYKGANGNLAPAEILLDDKKIFMASAIRVATRKIDANGVLGPVFTYEDILHHADGTEAVSLHALYNGHTNITTNNSTRITTLDNDLFRQVPNRIKAENAGAVTAWPQYGSSLEEKGYFNLDPSPIFETEKTNGVTVNLQGGTGSIEGAAGKKNILQVNLFGFLYDPASSGNGFCGKI